MKPSRHLLIVIGGRLLVLAVILIGAELGVRFGLLSPLFFSSPSQIAVAFQEQLDQGTLLPNLGITVFETLLGWWRARWPGLRSACCCRRCRSCRACLSRF